MATTAPFARFEWMIAWRYIRAKRAEGGVSVMTWISLIGITLAVFALIATLALRTGFRAQFIDTMLGANAHVTVYQQNTVAGTDIVSYLIADYDQLAGRIAAVPGVLRAAPLVRAQVMANRGNGNAGVEVFGISADDLNEIPLVAQRPDEARGTLDRFDEGIAIGWGVAQELGVTVGDRIRIISPNGVRTAMGTSPRTGAFEVVYIFRAGLDLIDRTRIYMPLDEAQLFFNRDGVADEIEVSLETPDAVDEIGPQIAAAAGENALLSDWKSRLSGFNNALNMQDNFIFILLSLLVLIATLNIVSGLVMLVKNKGRDIGILRTMGLTEGSILRVFFIVGASIGTIGTLCGVLLGVVFSLNIAHVYALVDQVSGNGVSGLEAQGFFFPDAILEWGDMVATIALSLALSWVITIFPARRAARMNPVEALRYE
ncbi:ABC transporter permease [Loktanella sp. TSTF-M6]|uniref:ABC transporter permease n=1 Tax=Loktanella gaetbuli TaxID=2881335 RepID=A0ABS8BV67_9RHOB|nr:ABC transporter permease [Loktanella gaetbuli]MCB5199567.1 ABC transporter permease [Loktanella gaetbuli]